MALGATLGGGAELPQPEPALQLCACRDVPSPGAGEEEESNQGGRSPVRLVFGCGTLAEVRSWLVAGLGSGLLQFPFSHSLCSTSN